ncbi:MAG: hypothetical protein V4628_14300 [Pseudomonadota bacterium]
MNRANYLGAWILIPELCVYQKGTPPLTGKYIISGNDHEIRFRIDWTDTEGTDHKLEFGGSLDGATNNVATPGITGVSYEKIDANTLDSTAYVNADVVMYARRVVSFRKDLLVVSQISYTDDGSFSNFQVYRREATWIA